MAILRYRLQQALGQGSVNASQRPFNVVDVKAEIQAQLQQPQTARSPAQQQQQQQQQRTRTPGAFHQVYYTHLSHWSVFV